MNENIQNGRSVMIDTNHTRGKTAKRFLPILQSKCQGASAVGNTEGNANPQL